MTVRWEHLAEALVSKIFNSHLWQSFDSIPKDTGHTESEWTMFSTSNAEAAALSCGLSWWQTTEGKEAIRLRESSGAWLACGTLEAVNGYWQAKQNAAQAVSKAKTWMWEELSETMEKDFRTASNQFWQTIR